MKKKGDPSFRWTDKEEASFLSAWAYKIATGKTEPTQASYVELATTPGLGWRPRDAKVLNGWNAQQQFRRYVEKLKGSVPQPPVSTPVPSPAPTPAPTASPVPTPSPAPSLAQEYIRQQVLEQTKAVREAFPRSPAPARSPAPTTSPAPSVIEVPGWMKEAERWFRTLIREEMQKVLADRDKFELQVSQTLAKSIAADPVMDCEQAYIPPAHTPAPTTGPRHKHNPTYEPEGKKNHTFQVVVLGGFPAQHESIIAAFPDIDIRCYYDGLPSERSADLYIIMTKHINHSSERALKKALGAELSKKIYKANGASESVRLIIRDQLGVKPKVRML